MRTLKRQVMKEKWLKLYKAVESLTLSFGSKNWVKNNSKVIAKFKHV